MSTAETEGQNDIQDGGEDEQMEQAAVQEGRNYDTVALRELRRARRLIRDTNEGDPIAPEAELAVGIANVLATLDLAAAIREHQGNS